MELSFDFLPFIDLVIENPMYMVLWAAFGVPVVMLLAIVLFKWVSRFSFTKKFYMIIYGSLFLVWIIGFAMMILLFFLEVSAEKLYVIWWGLFFMIVIFSLVNVNALIRFFDEIVKDAR
ncbi:hypothetical protein ACFSTE_07205 [Aquimarina hainanensis]|uniref:DUF4282 domain-containing protein n=1 Tax=Aquimarina hainanensis TaxID=1578017 RepID=A0ABW5N4P5_9FLAO